MREINVELEITKEELRRKLDVKDGQTPTEKEIRDLIEPLIPEPIKGDKGDNGKIPDHEWDGTKIRFQNPDGTWGKWVDLQGKTGGKYSIFGGLASGKDMVKDYDLSSQLDGVTKTFNIPAVWNIISVDLSSFPYGSLRKNVDYTYTPTTITFTSEIDAATQLATGQSCVLTIVV